MKPRVCRWHGIHAVLEITMRSVESIQLIVLSVGMCAHYPLKLFFFHIAVLMAMTIQSG